MALECVPELFPRIAAIGEDMAQPREAEADGLENIGCAVAVLNVGGMDEDEDQKSAGVGDDVPLATLDLLARVIARYPPLSVVLTDWLSMTPAVGLASRPACSRAVITSRWLIVVSRPLSRQA